MLKLLIARPRLIHQTHACMILEAPPLKDSSGKELHQLHDTVQQHLRALRAMDYDPSSPFITSVLELKLDVNTMFEWQKHSKMLPICPTTRSSSNFIKLRAQASETPAPGHKGYQRNDRKNFPFTKPVTSFAVSASEPNGNCVLCKSEKHPLYACTHFKSLSHEKMLSTLRVNKLKLPEARTLCQTM